MLHYNRLGRNARKALAGILIAANVVSGVPVYAAEPEVLLNVDAVSEQDLQSTETGDEEFLEEISPEETPTDVEEAPAEEETPTDVEEAPAEEETPTDVEEAPAEEETPTDAEEVPAEEETPTDVEEVPAEEETPTDAEEVPAEEETPTDAEEAPAEEETPADAEEAPVEEETPTDAEETPVEEETPTDAEETPVEEETPTDVDIQETVTEEKLENEVVQTEAEGWHQDGEKWYYVESGERVTDEWRRIDGYWYCFDEEGFMYADRVVWIKGSTNDWGTYRFDQKGRMVTGWFEKKWDSGYSNWYYYTNQGMAARGIQNVSGSTYYFYSDGQMAVNCTYTEDNILYRFGEDGKLTDRIDTTKSGWQKTSDGNYFYLESGQLVQNAWREINGYRYYFDWNGLMAKDVSAYISDENGTYSTYRFDKQGHLFNGWYQDSGSSWFYYNNGIMLEGLQKVNGVQYYFFDGGWMAADYYYNDGKNLYYFGSDGKMVDKISASSNGWKKMGADWYYVKAGKFLKEEWLSDGGYWYYFDHAGKMYADDVYEISQEGSDRGKSYRFDAKGRMIKGWYQNEGTWYYYTGSGAASGLQKINGKTYYFSSNGRMMVNGSVSINGVLYAYGADGVCSRVSKNGWLNNTFYVENGKPVIGWKKLSGKYYYFDPEGGAKKRRGVYEIDGKYYSFNSDGVMETGWIRGINDDRLCWMYAEGNGALVSGAWKKIGSSWYYFDDFRVMVTGIRTIAGKKEAFRADGTWIGTSVKNGWYKDDSGSWYYMENGSSVVNASRRIDGKDYQFDKDGRMYTNIFVGSRYYGSNGVAVTNQWKKDSSGRWCYFGADGNRVYSGWEKIASSWYYFERGYAVTEDKVIEGKLYHFTKSGVSNKKGTSVKNGWNLVDGHYYYYKNGFCLTGLQTIGKSRYYFDSNGKMEYQGRIYLNGDHYFATKNGSLAVNAWCKDGDSYYYAGADGRLVTGLQTIRGKKYYFSKYGYMYQVDVISEDAKTLYVIDTNGVVTSTVKAGKTGWTKSGEHYFYSKNGTFVTGYQKINGKAYYFYSSGIMASDQIAGSYGYADENGQIHTDGWYGEDHMIYVRNGRTLSIPETVNGKKYYFAGSALNGLFFVDGRYYNYNGNKGTRTAVSLKEGWNKVNNEWYYVRNGAVQTGSCEIDSKFYHFDSDGMMMRNCLYSYDFKVQYLDGNGLPVRNCWKQMYRYEGEEYEFNEKVWYYFDANGFALTGKQTVNGKTYLFDMDGRML